MQPSQKLHNDFRLYFFNNFHVTFFMMSRELYLLLCKGAFSWEDCGFVSKAAIAIAFDTTPPDNGLVATSGP